MAYTIDADGAYERVSDRATWASTDDGIARPLAANATITKGFIAVAPGNASVIARFQGLEATAPMLVVDSVLLSTRPNIELSWSGQNVVGSVSSARVLFRASSGSNQDATSSASWTSSNSDVATVDRGVIRAVGSGTTIITASFEGLFDWFWFSVIPKP